MAPTGSRAVNVAPRAASETNVIEPPCRFVTSAYATESPAPQPRPTPLVVNNGSTTRDAPTGPGVRAHVEVVATTLDGQFPAVAELLRDAKADITAIAGFPEAHWRNVWSTNPLERLNNEVKRRTDVVGLRAAGEAHNHQGSRVSDGGGDPDMDGDSRTALSQLDAPEPFEAVGVEGAAAADGGRVHNDRVSDCVNDCAAAVRGRRFPCLVEHAWAGEPV